MDELLEFLRNLENISINRLTRDYNNPIIVNRELLPNLYHLLENNTEEFIVVVMRRRHPIEEPMPGWFRNWDQNNFQPTVQRIERIETRLTNVENRLTGVENRLTNVENRLTNVENRLTNVENRLDKHDQMFKEHGWM